MIKKSHIFTTACLMPLGLLPLIALAQGFEADYIFTRAGQILYWSMTIVFGLATLVFLWGVVLYVIASGDEKKTGSARTYMLWGIIGLAVMAGVWGFVNLLLATLFNGRGMQAPGLPGLPYGGGAGDHRSDDCAALLQNPETADALEIAQCGLEGLDAAI